MPTAPGPSVSLLMMTTSACGLPRKSRRCRDTCSGVLGAVMSVLLRWAGVVSRFLWLVVAVGAADPVVGVAELVLGDVRGAVVWGEHQVLLEHHGPERPAGRGLQAVAEILEALVGLAGVGDKAGGLHDPRVAVRVVEDEGRRAAVDPELGVALAGDCLVGDAFVFAEFFGHIKPHDPACLEPHEIALLADHDLRPVKAPEPRAVLERAENVVLPGERVHIDLVEYRLGSGIPGPAGV